MNISNSQCQNWQANGQVPNEPELRASGRTNFVGGIAASRPHRRTDSTVRPTPGTTDVRIRYSWYEVPYWYEYLLPACMHAGRQAGRQASRTNLERIPNAYRKFRERIPNASRPKMRAPVSTCSAVQYRTTYPRACSREAGRKAGIPIESRTNPERIANASRTYTVRK